jgi:O-antigen/teichoic acid export membrane protein
VSGLLAVISLTRPPEIQPAVFVLGLAVIANSFIEFIGYAFRGLQRVDHEAALVFLARGLVVAIGIWAIQNGLGLAGLAAAHLLGSGVAGMLGYAWLSRRFFKPILRFDRPYAWALLREALPLGGAILISIAYTRTAVFLLDVLRGPEATGLYGVAQKLIEPMAVIPAALMAAIFPAFIEASAHKTDAERADWLRARAIRLAGIFGAALAAAGALGGPGLIQLLYRGNYTGSAAILQILALALPPAFINYALTHFLVALGKQKLNLLFSLITFALNLALCLALIPGLGPLGAAIAILVSECALFGLCRYALSR